MTIAEFNALCESNKKRKSTRVAVDPMVALRVAFPKVEEMEPETCDVYPIPKGTKPMALVASLRGKITSCRREGQGLAGRDYRVLIGEEKGKQVVFCFRGKDGKEHILPKRVGGGRKPGTKNKPKVVNTQAQDSNATDSQEKGQDITKTVIKDLTAGVQA